MTKRSFSSGFHGIRTETLLKTWWFITGTLVVCIYFFEGLG